jgi:hypothetical protein
MTLPCFALNQYDISPQARTGMLQDCTVRFRRMKKSKVRKRLRRIEGSLK